MRTLIAALFIAATLPAYAVEKPSYDAAAVARIQAAIVDCVGCNLKGADLSNTCVKEHNLTGANLAGAKMDGADLTGAKTSITSFLGTDLTKTKGLTQAQLDIACSDSATKLPGGLKAHTCH